MFAKVTVPLVGNGGRTTRMAILSSNAGNSEGVSIKVTGSQLSATQFLFGGTESTIAGGTVTYDPAVHVWWRIREAAAPGLFDEVGVESAGVRYFMFDYSANGVDWTTLASQSVTWDTSNISLVFISGYTGSETPDDAYVDNVNVSPVDVLAGQVDGVGTAVGSLGRAVFWPAGSAAGASSGSAVMTAGVAVSGAGAGVATVTGALGVTKKVGASAAGVGTAGAALTGAPVAISGSAAAGVAHGHGHGGRHGHGALRRGGRGPRSAHLAGELPGVGRRGGHGARPSQQGGGDGRARRGRGHHDGDARHDARRSVGVGGGHVPGGDGGGVDGLGVGSSMPATSSSLGTVRCGSEQSEQNRSKPSVWGTFSHLPNAQPATPRNWPLPATTHDSGQVSGGGPDPPILPWHGRGLGFDSPQLHPL